MTDFCIIMSSLDFGPDLKVTKNHIEFENPDLKPFLQIPSPTHFQTPTPYFRYLCRSTNF